MVAHLKRRKEQKADSGLRTRCCQSDEAVSECIMIAGDVFLAGGKKKPDSLRAASVTLGDRRGHQTRSFVGGLLGDQQVRLLHTSAYSA